MSEQHRMTVTLHWRTDGSEHETQVAFFDQAPQQLIPRLLERLRLPSLDRAGDKIVYELRLGGEQRPALRSRDPLSSQGVRFGSDLWLVAQALSSPIDRVPRCLLRLPDGSEIIVPNHGQGLTQAWLLAFLYLYNPEIYMREVQRLTQRRSAYSHVDNQRPHCSVRVLDRNEWVVTTDRSDVLTEYANGHDFDRIPVGAPILLESGMRLRLGGSEGLELSVTIV